MNVTASSTPTEMTGRWGELGGTVRKVGTALLLAGALVLPALPAGAQTVSPTTATTTTTTSVATVTQQQLYAGSLWATLVLDDVNGFIPQAFDDRLFSLTGPFTKSRDSVIRFHNFQATTLSAIQSAAIEVRMTHTKWVDDTIALEYSVDSWRTARTLTTFSTANRVPSSLTTLRFEGLQSVISTPELARTLEVRVRNVSHVGKADALSLTFDQVRLELRGS